MTRITPLRLTTLQLRQIFLTDALTFIRALQKREVQTARYRAPFGAPLVPCFFIKPSY